MFLRVSCYLFCILVITLIYKSLKERDITFHKSKVYKALTNPLNFPRTALGLKKKHCKPYKKVTGSVYVCLSVPKDLYNHLTDMVLLYSVASHRSQKGLNLFYRRVPSFSQEKSLKKSSPPQEASRGVAASKEYGI